MNRHTIHELMKSIWTNLLRDSRSSSVCASSLLLVLPQYFLLREFIIIRQKANN